MTNWSFLGDSLWSGDDGYYLMLASDNNVIIVVVGFSRTLPNLLLLWVPLTFQPAVTVHRCQTYNLGGVFKEEIKYLLNFLTKYYVISGSKLLNMCQPQQASHHSPVTAVPHWDENKTQP